MKRKHFIMLALTGVISCSMLLTGCRQTDVLEQIVYSNDATEIDYDKLEYLNEKNSEEDPEMDDITEDQSDQEDDQEQTDALQGAVNNLADHVSDLEYSNDAATDQSGHSGNTTNNEGSSETESGADSDFAGDNSAAELNPTNDNTNLRQVIDANGNVITIPENVDRVSATGAVAEYVEMLGGNGRLVAASSSFATTSFSQTVYGESVQSLWSGDGRNTMSDSDFQKLLASKPEVCLVENGNETFSSAQIQKLSEQNIFVVTVPRFNTSSNVKSGVELLGKILGDKTSTGGQNAIKNSEDYIAWYDSVISKVSGKCKRFSYNNVDYNNDRSSSSVKYSNSGAEGYYSLFVDSWDDTATYTVFNSEKGTVLSGNGAGAARSGYSSSPLSYFMSLAGVCNMSAAYDDFGTEKEWYVNGLLKGNFDISITGKYTDYSAGSQTSPYLTRLDDMLNANHREAFIQLGDERYPTVIAASKDIKSKLESSPLMQYSGPEGTNLGGLAQTSTLAGTPNYVVNPQGAASWYTGSPESPLEAMWISAQFGTGISQDELKSEIKNFYSKFYRYNLTDNQVTAILAGN